MKSMTGYGCAEAKVGKGKVFIEIRSVNHRYCDIQLKIPPRMNSLDPSLRKLIKSNVDRGRVDLFLAEKKGITKTKELSLDVALAKKYHKCLEQLQKELRLDQNVHLLEAIDARELINVEDIGVDYSKYWTAIRRIALQALKKMDAMRAKEGQFLLKDQKARVKKLTSMVVKIERQSKVSIKKQQEKIKSKFRKLDVKSDNAKDRMEAEIVTAADKMDIAEELTRLRSHLNQFAQIISRKGQMGRQMDFLIQEMNREINTIGSKASDAMIAGLVINVKGELEKLREQAQNIE